MDGRRILSPLASCQCAPEPTSDSTDDKHNGEQEHNPEEFSLQAADTIGPLGSFRLTQYSGFLGVVVGSVDSFRTGILWVVMLWIGRVRVMMVETGILKVVPM